MKLDFVYPKPNDNNPVITQTNKATTNYMQIVNNVNNTINNIDPVVQQENNKIKDKMCILANKVNKLISDMKHAERNIHKRRYRRRRVAYSCNRPLQVLRYG